MAPQTAVSPRRHKTKISLRSSALVCLAAGYTDLVQGGTGVSAALLTLAYCALIPAALWYSDREPAPRGSGDAAASYSIAAATGLGILSLYLATMAPSTAMWDTSEYLTAAYVFGIPHPPGNPFFVIVGHLFSLLPIAPTVAGRINVLAAICSAAAASMWYLVAEHVARRSLAARWQHVTAGVFASLIGATAFTVWNQSVVNEKVYTVSLAGIAIVSWLAIRWSAHPGSGQSDRLLVIIAYLCGLGYANHMAGMLPAPAVAFAVLMHRPRTFIRWRLVLACAAVLVIGVTPFATQPIRAAHFPAINEGEPTACRTKLELSCTFSKGTYDAFMYNLNRGQYAKPALSDRQASFSDQIGMWWMYFEWQWDRDAKSDHPFLQSLAAALFLALGVLGGWTHFKRDRETFWYFGTLMFTLTVLLVFYLNFKLGASQPSVLQGEREVRDRDYFYLWGYSAWGVWAALGLVRLWSIMAELVASEHSRMHKARPVVVRRRVWLATTPILLIALVPLGCNWRAASRARHQATRDIAADLLNSVEPYGVLITVGDNDTFPLWYAQEVEGIRRDVVVAVTSLLNTDWYARGIVRRPVYPYDEAHGPAIYRRRRWVVPSGPPLRMTLADVDSVAEYYPLTQPMRFSVGGLTATVDPRRLEHGVLLRADLFVLRMIQDSWPERPIYFARSGPGYPRQLGLENNTLTQGLAAKLWVRPANAAMSADTVFVRGDGWLDVARTKALWDSVFVGQKSVITEGQWIDRPSASMPSLYVFAGFELATALRGTGRVADGTRVWGTASRVAHAAGLDELAQAMENAARPASEGDSNGVSLRAVTPRERGERASEPMAGGRGRRKVP